MMGVYVSVPIGCFRRGMAREYLETEVLPPPATCYGFLLSLVGETDRYHHTGARVAPVLLGEPATSVVLRTVWRVKSRPLGSKGNTRPDYQQLLTGLEIVIWLDSSDEDGEVPNLESRVALALNPATRKTIVRFGALSLGESTHMVDQIMLLTDELREILRGVRTRSFLIAERGRLSLPVWVDHVGSRDTVHVVGDLVDTDLSRPKTSRMPQIRLKVRQ